MVETVYDLCQPFNVYNGVSHETGSKFFLGPWAIYSCVAANMTVIKMQSEPNPSYFPMWSLREDD